MENKQSENKKSIDENQLFNERINNRFSFIWKQEKEDEEDSMFAV